MSNIHGMNEYRNNANQNRQVASQQRQGSRSTGVFGNMDGVQIKHPRNENPWDMFKYQFCPSFQICSFTNFVVLANLVMFIGVMIHSQVEYNAFSIFFFLGGQPQTLEIFGLRMPYLVQRGEIQRLVLCVFLNYSLQQLVISIIIQMVVGFMIETAIGPLRMAALYFLIVIGGNLFGCLLTDQYAMGSDVAVFGLIGSLLALVIVNWSAIEGQAKCCAIVMVIFLAIVQIMLMVQAGQYAKVYAAIYNFEIADTYGALGGFFVGLFSGLFLMPSAKQDQSSKQCARISMIVGVVLTLIWFGLFAGLFFGNKETKEFTFPAVIVPS